MVSRGGRSRGCANCRRRRIKCDEGRPVCERCLKRGLDDCGGPKEQTFIVSTGKDGFQLNAETDAWNPATALSVVASKPSPELSLSAFQVDMCLAYTRKVLLTGGPVELACRMVSWNDAYSDQRPELKLLRDAITSLSITFFASQHRQRALQNRGYQQYGTVLRQLNTHLGLPELQTSDHTILTALLCMLTECIFPTGPKNFLKHLQGIETLLELRGLPPDPMPETTFMLYHGLRTLIIVGGLAMRRPCLYSREEWKQLPCALKSDTCRIKAAIFTILADCTRFMAERDALLPSEKNRRHSLLAEVKAAFSKTGPIYQRWVILNQRTLGDPNPHPMEHTGIADPRTGLCYLIYNVLRICLLDLLQSLEPSQHYSSLRNNAALNIIEILQHKKEYERQCGISTTNTTEFIATQLAWHAIADPDTPEGELMAEIIRDTIGGVFSRSTWGEDVTKKDSGSWNHHAAEVWVTFGRAEF